MTRCGVGCQPESTPPESIHKAMRYSLFAGGKRIRPLLCIAAAEAVSDVPAGIESAACTLELIHTYSLIHDDLPALDNDDLRRGMPTCHKVFGEAMAILAGDALLTLAFQVLAQMPCEPARKTRLIEELAVAAGTVGGMIGGQVHDIEGERKHPTAALLDAIHRAKTGALLRASVKMGGIYAGADSDQLNALCRASANTLGLRFKSWMMFWTLKSRLKHWARPPEKTRSRRRSPSPRCMAWIVRAKWRKPSASRHTWRSVLSMSARNGCGNWRILLSGEKLNWPLMNADKRG